MNRAQPRFSDMCATFPARRKAPQELADLFRATRDGCDVDAGGVAGPGVVGASSGSAGLPADVVHGEAGGAELAVRAGKRPKRGETACRV